MTAANDDAIARWSGKSIPKAQFRHHPSETMLKVLLSSRYSTLHAPVEPGWRVLDVGCFETNNLVPFADRGCECHGVEINADMVAAARIGAQRTGIAATLVEGNNRTIPYGDGSFDLLLSINTVHYEQSMADVGAALTEFARVLKPGGRAFVMTHGPRHFIQSTAKHIDGARMIVGAPGDFRAGTIQTAFNSSEALAAKCRETFADVDVGVLTEEYPTQTLQFFWALCRKG